MAQTKKRRGPDCDPQREAVYEWERKNFQSLKRGSLPAADYHKMVRETCRLYQIPRPVTRTRLPRKYATDVAGMIWHEKLYIHLQHRTPLVICHELAHWVYDKYGYPGPQWHCPLWLGIYLYLLAMWQVLPLAATVPLARKAGLKMRRPSECTPKTLRRYVLAHTYRRPS